jgi:hypothetical protein
MGWSPIPLVAVIVRLSRYTGRPERIASLVRELARSDDALPSAVGELLDAPGDELSRAEQRLACMEAPPRLLAELFVHGVEARLPHADVAAVETAIRRVRRMLERSPSATVSTTLKRHEALLACRQGLFASAISLLEASIATSTAMGDLPEAALGRHWLAKVKYELEIAGSEALVDASEKELADLGIVSSPEALRFGAGDALAPSSSSSWSIVTAVERLSVRGLSPAMIERELVSVVSAYLDGRDVVLEELDDEEPTLGDLRLVVEGGIPEHAEETVQVLLRVARLALALAR